MRPARRSSTAPRKRTFLPSSALPPPERANGEGGAATGAVAPPEGAAGSCASAVAGATATSAATDSTMRVSDSLNAAFSGAYEVS